MRRLLVPFALAALAACGGSSPTDPNGGGGGGGGGGGNGSSLSATIDGTAWAAAAGTVAASANTSQLPGGLLFTGNTITQPGQALIFTLGRIAGPGTYPLGVNQGTNAGGTLTMTLGSSSWWTPLSGDAGSVTITSMANGRVQGTFTANLVRLAGTGGAATVSITNGKFNVPINPGYAAPAADDQGSVVTASIAGETFKGATIVGIGGGTSLIGITATNDSWTLSLTAGPVDASGTLPIANVTVPIRKVTVIATGAGVGWGGTQADVGTFTITSVTAKRLVGSFSATLAPIGGSGGSKVVTGTFDVRVAP